MDIITTARHLELASDVREHAERRLRKLERYVSGVQEVHLVLSKEKYRHVAEVTLRANGTDIISRDESDDLVSSIDRVVDRVERQVKKLRARITDKGKSRRKNLRHVLPEAQGTDQEVEEQESEETSYAPVVEQHPENFRPEAITVAAAIEDLLKRDEDVLLFKNSKTGAVSLVYVRPDGNIGFTEAV